MQIVMYLLIGWVAYAACMAILGAIDRIVHEGGAK